MIGVVDMGMGNLRSVANAIYSLGFDVEVVSRGERLGEMSHLVIPGVGSYPAAMGQLARLDLKKPITDFAASGKPLMGICLGMQIFSDFGDEGGVMTTGLGLVAGKVEKISPALGLSVPHVGWNNIEVVKKDHPLFLKVKSGVDFYFVHSYYFLEKNRASVIASTEYGKAMTSMIGEKNVVGLQFHPEKSQINGLRLLENFCQWDGKC